MSLAIAQSSSSHPASTRLEISGGTSGIAPASGLITLDFRFQPNIQPNFTILKLAREGRERPAIMATPWWD
jgi:hypothetical protein